MRPVVFMDGDRRVHAWLCGLEIMPIADDPAFLHAAQEAKKFTGMDEMRLATIWQAVLSSRHCEQGELIEVGCGGGGSGLFISMAQEHAGIGERLTLVDTFAGIVKSGPMDHHQDGEMVSDHAAAAELLGSRATVVKAVFPDEFSSDANYRFAHIDVDTYASALESFRYLLPRMVPGSVIVMDDYGVNTTPGIKLAVDELDLPGIRWVFCATNQAVAILL